MSSGARGWLSYHGSPIFSSVDRSNYLARHESSLGRSCRHARSPLTCSPLNILPSSTPALRPTLPPSQDATTPRDQLPLPSPSPLLHGPIHLYLILNPLLTLHSPLPPPQPPPPFLLSATSPTITVTHPPLPVLHLYSTSTNTLHRTFFAFLLPFSSRSSMRTMNYQGLQSRLSSPNPPTLLRIAIPTHPFGHPSPSHLAQPSPLLPFISHSMPALHPQLPSNPTSSVSSSIVQPQMRSLFPSSFISIAWPSSPKSRPEMHSSLTAVTSTASSSRA